jgi:hypothetical protein
LRWIKKLRNNLLALAASASGIEAQNRHSLVATTWSTRTR